MPAWLEAILIVYGVISLFLCILLPITLLDSTAEDEGFKVSDCLLFFAALGGIFEAIDTNYNIIGGIILKVLITILSLGAVIIGTTILVITVLPIVAFNKLFRKKEIR